MNCLNCSKLLTFENKKVTQCACEYPTKITYCNKMSYEGGLIPSEEILAISSYIKEIKNRIIYLKKQNLLLISKTINVNNYDEVKKNAIKFYETEETITSEKIINAYKTLILT